MRLVTVLAFMSLSASTAFCGEAYQATGEAYAACIGEQMRFAYNPPEIIEDVIDLKCGKLEELEQKQFFDFIAAQVDKVLSAETAFTITAHIMVSQRFKRDAVKAYVQATKKPRGGQSSPKAK
jgi:hypothetical protein